MLATGGAIRSTGEAIAPPVNMLDEALNTMVCDNMVWCLFNFEHGVQKGI